MAKKALILALVNNAVISLLVILHYTGNLSLPMWFSFQGYKFLHVVAAIFFLGNVLIGPIWVLLARSTKNKVNLEFAFKVIVLTDVLITIPAYDLTIWNGLVMAPNYGGYDVAWLNHTIYNLLAFSVLVLPVIFFQNKLLSILKKGDWTGKPFRQAFNWWMITGFLSFIPIAHIVYSMLFKA